MKRAARRLFDWLNRGRGSAPELVVIAAHPDDETIGAGGQLAQLPDALFVCVTDGAPREHNEAAAARFVTREQYAAARREELSTVLTRAGIKQPARNLNCVDQEASLELVTLTRAVATLLREVDPEAILTQPYEGGHPDHDATAFAVHSACQLLERSIGRTPAIVEMTSYHGRSGRMEAGTFLPSGECEEIAIGLSQEQCRFKAALFEHYRTQQDVLRGFPVDIERFRVAPEYDFTEPPHRGRLFYENFNWGMTGARWRDLARRYREKRETL